MEGYINPKDFWGDVLDDWRQHWVGSSIAERTINLISKSVILPNEEIQQKIACAYFWTNPKWSRCLPILFLVGPEGSGKSTLGTLVSHLREALIVDPTSTFASIRNDLNRIKFLDEDQMYESDGALFFLDNADYSVFQDKDMLNLFLSGFKKGMDHVRIAKSGEGENITFRTFSSRVVSSVHSLHSAYELREFGRRCLPIFHNQLERLDDVTPERKDCLIDLESVNWDGFGDEYHTFWGNRQVCKLYTEIHSRIRPVKGFKRARYEMCKDLIATGVVIGLWQSSREAQFDLIEYFTIAESKTTSTGPLEEFLAKQFLIAYDDDQGIPNADLMKFIDKKVELKQLLEKPRPKAINEAMAKNGWAQSMEVWIKTK